MLVGGLGIWPAIVGIEDRGEEWQRIGEWSTEEGELRRLRTLGTI